MPWFRNFRHDVKMILQKAFNAAKQFIKLAKILDINFPERTRHVFIARAPMMFTAVWKLVSPFVPAATKVSVQNRGGYTDPQFPAQSLPFSVALYLHFFFMMVYSKTIWYRIWYMLTTFFFWVIILKQGKDWNLRHFWIYRKDAGCDEEREHTSMA